MKVLPKDRDLNDSPEFVELQVRASDLQQKVEEVSVRLDQFLQRFLTWRSRTGIQDLIRDGHLYVDASTPDHPEGSGELVQELRPGRKLRHGSRVVIEIPEAHRIPEASFEDETLTILYEDERVVAVDKPPHMVVHPAGRHLSGTLIQRIHRMYPSPDGTREARPRLAHRLDRETSGIVLIGKDPIAHSDVMGQFEDRKVIKEYLAIVRGSPMANSGSARGDLGPARGAVIGLKMAVVEKGLPSRTDWRVIERFADCTLILCRLHTGRQHQIRVHMEDIGLPLVGDKLYGADSDVFERDMRDELTREDLEKLGLGRHALHNHRLVFTTPAGRKQVEVVSELAPDLQAYLDARRGGA